jgi:hypothetical protein
MDKANPINFYHACTLLYRYCQLYASKYEPIDNNRLPGSDEANLGGTLQRLNVTLQKMQRHNAGAASTLAIKALNHPDYRRYIHTLEAHGYVYDILDIVTHIHRHLYDLPDEFWANKDDVNMREYNPFQSPRAESGATGPSGARNTPVDVRQPFSQPQASRPAAVSLESLRTLYSPNAQSLSTLLTRLQGIREIS